MADKKKQSEPIAVTPSGILLGTITSFAFGASVVTNKAGLDSSGLTALDYTALSALAAAVIAFPFLLPRVLRIVSCSKTCLVKVLVIAVGASGIAYLLLFYGQSLTSATNAGFMLTLTAFFTVVFAAALIGERIEKRRYPAIGLLFIGLYLLIVGVDKIKLNAGDLFIAGTAFIWGFTNSIARSVMREIPAQIVALIRLFIGGLFLAAVLRAGPGLAAATVSSGDYWFLLSGLLGFASILLFYRTIGVLGAGMASLVVVSSPIFSTLGAVVFLGERLAAEDLVGGALVLVALVGITGALERVSRSARE